MLALVFSILTSGSVTSLIGYYSPTMYLGTVMMSVGAGLMTTFKVNTGAAVWVVSQIIFGLGIGFGFQQPIIATQTVFSKTELPSALVVVSFFQTLGGIVAVSAAQNVFSRHLVANLQNVASDVNPSQILDTGILNLKSRFTKQQLAVVLPAYNRSITQTLIIGLVMSCITIVGVLGIPRRSVKTRTGRQRNDKRDAQNEESGDEKAVQSAAGS